MSEKKCPSCGAPIDLIATECKYCGEAIVVEEPQYQVPQDPPVYSSNCVPVASKSKIIAGLLGIFLGGIGAHKFYLGKIGMGVLYLVFCWTYIPVIVGFIEGIIYLASSDEEFYYKYVRK